MMSNRLISREEKTVDEMMIGNELLVQDRTNHLTTRTTRKVSDIYCTQSNEKRIKMKSKHFNNNNNNNQLLFKKSLSTRRKEVGQVLTSSSLCFIFVAIISSLIFTSLLCQCSVIRPTVFSDLNTSPQQQQQQDNNNNNNINPAAQQQQSNSNSIASPSTQTQVQLQQQQQQQTREQQSQQSSNNLNTLSVAPLPAVALADASAGQQQQQQQHHSTKINPIKSRFCYASNNLQQRLDQPLGLQSYAIDDLAINSSSSNNEQVKPHLARLNLDIRGGAWCPANPVHAGNFGKEWIQIKLNRSHVITAIETQGRFGMGNGKEFVPSYQIEYSRNAGRTWHKWKDVRGSNLLRANDDPNSAVKNELSPPIVGANVIRIFPYSSVPRTVCMRLELHGCLFDEGAPIAYSTLDGVVEPRWGHLIDYTYDGQRMASGELTNGLGQLIDGVKGPDNFSYNNGFEWVGWKSMNGDVVIEFTFRTLRNFTGALFHSNNLFSKGVEVFQAVDVHYGIDIPLSMETLKDSLHEQQRRQKQVFGLAQSNLMTMNNEQQSGNSMNNKLTHMNTMWSQDVLSIEYEPDKKSESSRPVTVHLKQRLANKLKFVLKFASKWILVSEVEFLSHPVELLSLASLSQLYTAQLMAHLKPAKSYDEYVAILREHQLRRLAAETLISSSSLASPSSSGVTSTSTELSSSSSSSYPITSSEQPNPDQLNEQQQQQQQEDPFLAQIQQQNRRPIFQQWPPTKPILPGDPNSPLPNTNPNFFLGSSNTSPSSNFYPPNLQVDPLNSLSISPIGSEQRQQKQTTTTTTTTTSPIGFTTVISFVVVLVILLVGLLFVISSYRMRSQSTSKLGRHLTVGGGGGGGSMMDKPTAMGPSLHNFMSVFSSPNSIGGGNQNINQQVVVSTAATTPHHYNAIFASQTTQRRPNHHHHHHHNNNQHFTGVSALKRLATLGHSSSSSNKHHHHHLNSTTMANGQQSPSSGNQLLVSLKDASSSSGSSSGGVVGGGSGAGNLFSSPAMGASKGISGINTQLIIGLNQPPTLPLQQQQTYATHYSTSMSMASSSTNGGQHGDDGDYAIPDAVPIIPPASHHHQQHYHQHQMIAQHQHPHPHQQQQQPFVSRLTQNGQQVRSSLINYQQQQQQQQNQQLQNQHNYEQVYSTEKYS